MGLDLYLTKGPCKHCGHMKHAYEGAYTYNVSRMWYRIFPKDKDMIPIDGMTGKKSLKLLKDARQKLLDNRQELEKLNPENGWGSFEGFVKYIEALINASEENPDYVWSAWR